MSEQPQVTLSEYFVNAGEPEVPHFQHARRLLTMGIPEFQKKILPHIESVNFPPSDTGGFAPLVGGSRNEYALLLDIHMGIDPLKEIQWDQELLVRENAGEIPQAARYPFAHRYLLTASRMTQAQAKKFISLFRKDFADFIRKNSGLM